MLFVGPRISKLDVTVYQIHVGQYPSAEYAEVEISTGLQDYVDLASFEPLQERLDVVGIQGTLTARKRDSTAGLPVEWKVTRQDFYEGTDRVILPYLSQSLPGADPRTLATAGAPGPVDSPSA